MKKEIAEKWVQALRSGDYKQGSDVLHNTSNNTYCCLGVLCDIYQQEGNKFNSVSDGSLGVETANGFENLPATFFDDHPDVLPEVVMKWADISCSSGSFDGSNLAALNDDDGYTFDEIATVIEANVEYL
jgi:hypothetical protein